MFLLVIYHYPPDHSSHSDWVVSTRPLSHTKEMVYWIVLLIYKQLYINELNSLEESVANI